MFQEGLVPFARAYLNTLIPDVRELRRGLEVIEGGFRSSTPDYDALLKLADTMTNTMGFRASSAEVCETFFRENQEQLIRLVDLAAGTPNPGQALRSVHEVIRGAYAAVELTRSSGSPGRDLYDQISRWRYATTDAAAGPASVVTLKGLLAGVLADVQRNVPSPESE